MSKIKNFIKIHFPTWREIEVVNTPNFEPASGFHRPQLVLQKDWFGDERIIYRERSKLKVKTIYFYNQVEFDKYKHYFNERT